MSVTIYHNPRCSKSRATLALLKKQGVEPNVIDYLKTPPTADELKGILHKLGLAARDILRKNEAPYKELGLSDESLPDDALILAMVEYPILLERPIVVKGKKAVIGRPPSNVIELL